VAWASATLTADLDLAPESRATVVAGNKIADFDKHRARSEQRPWNLS
jgi:hypothetical protein